MDSKSDPFFQVEHTRCDTSEGSIDLPIAYYDTDLLIALFAANPAPVRAALEGEPLSLVTIGGKARVALVFFRYNETSIGPYNEVGLATLTVPEGQRPPLLSVVDVLRSPRKRRIGFHVFKLPVTTAIANAAGRELWGFPKFVTPIDVELGRDDFVGRVADPDAEQRSAETDILCLEGTLPSAIPVPPVELMLLSRLDATLLRAVVDVRGKHLGGPSKGMQLRVGKGEHPMAAQLRDFGLDGAQPDLCIYARDGRSLLHLGDPVPQ